MENINIVYTQDFKDENYNPNDVGFLSSNNEINQTLSLSYHQFKENKNLIKSEVFLNTNRKTLFTDQKFIDLEIELESKFTLKIIQQFLQVLILIHLKKLIITRQEVIIY